MAYTPQMNPQPLGLVTVPTPGTPVRLTINLSSWTPQVTTAATDAVVCNKVFIAADPGTHAGAGNTGKVYIGQAGMVKATRVGVIAIIAAGGSFTISNNVSMNIYDASKLYMDADTAGDGCYITADTV